VHGREPIGLGHRGPAEQSLIGDAEDRRVCTDPQPEGEDCSRRERRVPTHLSADQAHIGL
jgi:hypothetical protein